VLYRTLPSSSSSIIIITSIATTKPSPVAEPYSEGFKYPGLIVGVTLAAIAVLMAISFLLWIWGVHQRKKVRNQEEETTAAVISDLSLDRQARKSSSRPSGGNELYAEACNELSDAGARSEIPTGQDHQDEPSDDRPQKPKPHKSTDYCGH
jgi:hypothetical protein